MGSLLKKMQILVCIFFITFNTHGQQNLDTLVDYNTYAEFPYSIYQVQDSGYVFITSGNDANTGTQYIEFNKISKAGSIVLQKTFGITGQQNYAGLSNSLKPTFDGGWAFGGGRQYPVTSANKNDGMLVKYNATGDTEFVKTLGDTSWETLYDCIQTSDSGFVLVGDKGKYSPSYDNDFWIVKTDATGNVLWERTLGTSKDEQAFVVIENYRHQVVVSGAKETTNPFHYPYVAIYDLQGSLIATKSFNQGAMICAAGNIRHYGPYDYLLAGCLDTVINSGDATYPNYIARLDSSLSFSWQTIYNAPEKKAIYIFKEISDGGIVLVGYKNDSVIGLPVGWIAKMDSSGNKLWEHFYYHNNNSYNYFSDYEETLDHGFIICGTAYNWSISSQDSWVVKLDSNGCLDNTCVINSGTHELIRSSCLLNVFPNPSRYQITVITNEEKGQLVLYDLLGKDLLQKKTEHEKQITFDISMLPGGIYLLQFRTGKQLFTAKLVKE